MSVPSSLEWRPGTVTNIEDWLKDLGLGAYCSVFADNDIDFAILVDLTDQI